MGLYNFKPQFVSKILAGEKTHTIRPVRANPDKVGNTLHLYTGLRQKGARLLMRVPCVKVEHIKITHADVYIDGNCLEEDEREALARRDGFADWKEMVCFWRGRLPFFGQVIHWRLA
jgi:hypothetical protein